jgi:uncharacterized protein YjbI with pentapeptide repeats
MTELKLLTINDVREGIKKGERDFSKSRIIGADFSGMDLSNIDFSSSQLEWVRFANCKLINTNFTSTKIDLSYFSNSDLTKAVFAKAKIYNSGFLNVTLDKTSFMNADIQYVLFVEANLGAANFSGANRIRVLTSFTELTQEDFNFILSALAQVNLPPSHRTYVTTLLDNVKGLTQEKLMKFYDMGRKIIASSTGYEHLSDSGRASTYSGKTKYGMQKKKETEYR